MNPAYLQMLMRALQQQGANLSPGTYRLPGSFAAQLYGMMGFNPQPGMSSVGGGQVRFGDRGRMRGEIRMEAPQVQVRSQQLTNLQPYGVYSAVTSSPQRLAMMNRQANGFMQQPVQLRQQTNSMGQQYQPDQIGMFGLNTRGSAY